MSATNGKRAVSDGTPPVAAPAPDSSALFGSIFAGAKAKSAPLKRAKLEDRSSESNLACCIPRGYILRNESAKAPGKRQTFGMIDSITPNGDISLCKSGVPLYDFIFPVIKLDPPGASEGGSSQNRAKPKELLYDGAPTCSGIEPPLARWVGHIGAGVFTQKDGKVEEATPGKYCEWNRFVHAQGKDSKFYMNASDVIPLDKEPVPDWELASKMMLIGWSKPIMQWSAFAWSMAMRGFQQTEWYEGNEALMEQALACQKIWTEAKNGIHTRLLDMSSKATATHPETQAAIKQHFANLAETVNNTPISELVKTGRLWDEPKYDSFYAPLVQTGLTPKERFNSVFKPLSTRDPVELMKLPDYFMGCFCSACHMVEDTKIDGILMEIQFKMQWVFDKTKAVEQAKKGVPALLHNGEANGGCKLMTESCGYWLGSYHDRKIRTLFPEIAQTAEMIIFAKPGPKDPSAKEAPSELPATWALDLIPSLAKAAFLVSEQFIVDKLCGGVSKGVSAGLNAEAYPVPQNEKIVNKDGKLPDLPRFSTHRVQEVTYSGFTFTTLRVDPGRKREWRILFQGACDILEKEPVFCTDPAQAESRLELLSATFDDCEGDVGQFLLKHCLVYACNVEDTDLAE